MVLKKCNVSHYGKKTSNHYVYRDGLRLRLSSPVRDSILPHRFVRIEILNNELKIIPSDCPDDYRLTIANGQASFSCDYLINLVDIPLKTRIPISQSEDGTITFNIQKRL